MSAGCCKASPSSFQLRSFGGSFQPSRSTRSTSNKIQAMNPPRESPAITEVKSPSFRKKMRRAEPTASPMATSWIKNLVQILVVRVGTHGKLASRRPAHRVTTAIMKAQAATQVDGQDRRTKWIEFMYFQIFKMYTLPLLAIPIQILKSKIRSQWVAVSFVMNRWHSSWTWASRFCFSLFPIFNNIWRPPSDKKKAHKEAVF